MRTPKEIKQGLQHCAEDGCKGCNYEHDCYMADGFSVLAGDALDYIRQLEAERNAMKQHILLYGDICELCRYGNTDRLCSDCQACDDEGCICASCIRSETAKSFEWQGGENNACDNQSAEQRS